MEPAYIADLRRLEDEIDEALIQKPTDDLMTVDLKVRKLHLKGEIERLRREATTCDEYDDLLDCRLAILGLHRNAIERFDGEIFELIRRRCANCDFRESCVVDLKRDPNNPVWESYCPNSAVLNALASACWLANAI
jgi:hypothetical protein